MRSNLFMFLLCLLLAAHRVESSLKADRASCFPYPMRIAIKEVTDMAKIARQRTENAF